MSEPITVEVNLRVPNISIDSPQAPGQRITNSEARFWKVISLPVLPSVGDDLELSTRTYAFHAIVKRLDWHEAKNLFVVACHYAKRSISPEQYDGLRADPDWTMRSLGLGN